MGISRPVGFMVESSRENDGNTVRSIGFRLEPFIDGKPIPGFTMEEYVELYSDEVEGEVRWKNGSDVSSLSGNVLRLRFRIRDADVILLKPAEDE